MLQLIKTSSSKTIKTFNFNHGRAVWDGFKKLKKYVWKFLKKLDFYLWQISTCDTWITSIFKGFFKKVNVRSEVKKDTVYFIFLNIAVSPSSTGSTNPMQGKNLFTRKNHRGSVENKPLPLHHDRVNSNFYGLFSKKKGQVHVMPTIRSRHTPPLPLPPLSPFYASLVSGLQLEGGKADHIFFRPTTNDVTIHQNFVQPHLYITLLYIILFEF